MSRDGQEKESLPPDSGVSKVLVYNNDKTETLFHKDNANPDTRNGSAAVAELLDQELTASEHLVEEDDDTDSFVSAEDNVDTDETRSGSAAPGLAHADEDEDCDSFVSADEGEDTDEGEGKEIGHSPWLDQAVDANPTNTNSGLVESDLTSAETAMMSVVVNDNDSGLFGSVEKLDKDQSVSDTLTKAKRESQSACMDKTGLLALFHLFVRKEAEKVTLAFENGFKSDLKCMSDTGRGKYWMSEPLRRNDREPYKYVVRYSRKVKKVKEETGYGRFVLSGGQNHYDVFKEFNKSKPDKTFEGKFFYVRAFYDRLSTDGANLNQTLIDIEQIRFADLLGKVSQKNRKLFSEWMTEVLKKKVTPYNIVCICSLLCHLLENDQSGNLPEDVIAKMDSSFLQGIILDRSAADTLLNALRQCPSKLLPQRAINLIKRIHLNLLGISSSPTNLHYVFYFRHLFEANSVIPNADLFSDFVLEEDKLIEIASKLIQSLVIEENTDENKILLNFVLSKVSAYPLLCQIFQHLPIYESCSAYDDILISYFIQRRLPITRSSWEETPQVLRTKLAVPFLKALQQQAEEKRGLHDSEFIMNLFFDRDLQMGAPHEMVELLKLFSSSTKNDVAYNVLSDQRILAFWKSVDEEDRKGVINNLVSSIMDSAKNVAPTICRLDELSRNCALESYAKVIEQCICQGFQSIDLRSIANACAEVYKTIGLNGKKWLIALLKKSLQKEQADRNVKSKLLDTIFTLPSIGNWLEIDRDQEEILFLLMKDLETKIPHLKSCQTPKDFQNAVTQVLYEKKLWSVIFQVKGGRLHKHRVYSTVKNVMNEVCRLLSNGDITFDFIKDENDQTNLAELLNLGCCSPLNITADNGHLQSNWNEVLTNLLSERDNITKRFHLLEKVIHLARETTDDDIILKDEIAISEEYNRLKKRLPETKFAEIRKENYWGQLECLVNPGEQLYRLCDSMVFKNFARNLLKESIRKRKLTESTVPGAADVRVFKKNAYKPTVQEILLLLSNEFQAFKNVCERITHQDCQITLKELDAILDGIEVHNVEQELKCVYEKIDLPAGIPMNVLEMLQTYVQFGDVTRKVRAVMKCLRAIGYAPNSEEPDIFLKHLQSFLDCKESGTLKSISVRMNEPFIVKVNKISSDLVDAFINLSNARELIAFILKTDSMVDLIEFVEEHSDQIIQETTVSYLIDVHRFLRELLLKKPEEPEAFLDKISDAYANLPRNDRAISTSAYAYTKKEIKLADKIKIVSCNVHSLQGLKKVANRGERTKEIIKNAVESGQYQVRIESDGSTEVQLIHDQSNNEVKCNTDDLIDLRYRALLMANVDKSHIKDADGQASHVSQQDLSYFIEQIDRLMKIVRNYKLLKMSGKPEYEKGHWRKCLNSMDEIREEESRVIKELKDWNEMMRGIRQKYFFLNYFHTKQLWILKSFFHNKVVSEEDVSGDVLALFRCIDSNINEDDLPHFKSKYVAKYVEPTMTETEHELHSIGSTLETIFRSSKEEEKFRSPFSKSNAVVEPEKLYVSILEPDSVQTVHVIMSLYENTCACLPKPSQLLFCDPRTTWDEIELLLLRTFEAHRHGFISKLHCIANVESLPNDIQFQLVDTLKTLMNDTDAPYHLAIVCRGGPHHHIADQFPGFVHCHGGTSDKDMREIFGRSLPDTFLVAGDLPGFGKTEEIYFHAGEKGKKVVTFPISGPFVRHNLVKRLSELKADQFQSIHFDIGEVDDPGGLDKFLFELIVTKVVSSEALIFSLPTNHVYIEIANTLQQGMRNSLPVCKCFKRLDVKWKDYSNLLISKELTSPVQIVCQYLNAYENGILEHQEIVLKGPKKVQPLNSIECQQLLKKHFIPGGDLSFSILENFLSVLAAQLLKFSKSPYFKPKNLQYMIGPKHDIRTRCFQALLGVSTSFATRSITTCKTIQDQALKNIRAKEALKKMKTGGGTTADQMVDRVKGMIQWSEIKHLVVMFHRSGSCTAIYHDLERVSQNVKDLFKSQAVFGEGLEDYTKMSQEELQLRLERFSDAPRNLDRTQLVSLSYALAPDNILKMALIIQRMQAGIPVIIMGETGCGKTSLVRYLAKTCAIPFEVFSFHAGITEQQIVHFISSEDKEARCLQKEGKSMWLFLDEINTCEYLGTINEIVCHRSIHGRSLATNLMFVAACNPYRLRPSGRFMTDGLKGKTSSDEFSKLVYRVHPLPETMIDYVWDYGSLSREDEETYIGRMVDNVFDDNWHGLLVDVLAESQEFIRNEEKRACSVSLRDVNRATTLMKWFCTMLQKREPTDERVQPEHIRRYFITAQQFDNTERAIVLALAHCYLSRLTTSNSRNGYCQKMTELLINHGRQRFSQHDSFKHIIRAEQEDYLSRMELPKGTAKNAALRENVFIILVCILCRIPVFVVGKPGCSKSLSMQIIRSNLRGKDSKDPFLKTLPQLLVVSFQGSESSTSEGIEKVFEKAGKYKSKSENVLPVVLLDEIGLAEISNSNPLKVLHRLLEPEKGEFPDVAVVGISNWALDPAKMNRAIHLSRPEPDIDDLYDTGLCIRNAQPSRKTALSDTQIKCLAEAYHEYQSKQKHENFHGLRDYYSMVKCLDIKSRDAHAHENSESIQRAMQRNFGGITTGNGELQSLFYRKLESCQPIGDIVEFPVTELIQDNLDDKMARHLMIITSRDSAIGILNQTLKDLNKERITIFGSRFEEDRCADYNHRILSRIIFFMERNCILVLRDLESIYGSLYDLLNQNYMVIGDQQHCRVALGAFSNSMCQVDDGFRCIVLVDEDKVDYSDPPFLNRFEKHQLRFSDILSEKQRNMIKKLEEWTKNISSVQDFETHFNEVDMFAGFHDDTLPSLVLLHSQESKLPKDEGSVIARCKDDLMSVAMQEAVIRSQRSKLNQISKEEVNQLYDDYFERPIHNGLQEYLKHIINQGKRSPGGMKLCVMTHSTIHIDVSRCVGGLFRTQTEKVSFFKSEKELSKQIKHFWSESSDNLLVVQCRPETDAPHMLLVKTIIEEQRKAYESSRQSHERQKHVCLLIHLRRSAVKEKCLCRWEFNFLSGWSQSMVECLEEPSIKIKRLLNYSITDVIKTGPISFNTVAADQLRWCFTRLMFPPLKQPNLDDISSLEQTLTSPRFVEVMNCFKKLCCNWIEETQEDSYMSKWQISVACDRQTLINSSTLVKAMEYFINHLVRRPLARIVYFLQQHSAFQALISEDAATRYECLKLMTSERVFKIADVQEPQDPESLVVEYSFAGLRFPFSYLFCKRIDTFYDYFSEELKGAENCDENEELTSNAEKELVRKIALKITNAQAIKEIIDSPILTQQISAYIDDFLDIKTEEVSDVLSRNQRIAIMKAHYGDKMPTIILDADMNDVVAQLHCNFWLEGNVIPEVFFFVKECMSTRLVDIDNFLKQYKRGGTVSFESLHQLASEEAANGSVVESMEDGRQPEENDEPSKQPVERDDEEDAGFPVEETQRDSNDIQGPIEEMVLEQNGIDGDDYDVNEQGEENPPDFEEFLVHNVCLSILPTNVFIERAGGIDEWINSADLVLSSSIKYCYPIPATYFLMVCSDFAKLDFPRKAEYLFRLADNGNQVVDSSYLDSPEIFDAVCNLVTELETINEDVMKLKEFRFLFYQRCLQSNPDSPMKEKILKSVSLSEDEHMLQLASSLLYKFLLSVPEEAFALNDVEKLISTKPLSDNHFPNLIVINTIISQKELDSHINVICCDLINKLAFKDIGIKKVTHSDHPAFRNFHKAMDVTTETDEKCKENVFGFICAVSYLRAFMSAVARALNDEQNASSLNLLLRDMSKRLKECKAWTRNSSVSLFLLKELGQLMCLYDVKQLIKRYEDLHFFNSLGWEENEFCKLESDPFQHHAAHSKAENVLGLHVADIHSTQTLDPLKLSCKSRMEFSAVIAEQFYVVRSTRKLTDTEDYNVAKFVTEHLTQVTIPYKNFVLRIASLESFKCTELDITPESRAIDVEVAVLIQYLTATLTSSFTGKSKNPIMCCLVNPTALKESYMVAAPDNISRYPLFKHYKANTPSEVHLFSCKCRTRFASQESVATKCPCCDSPVEEAVKGAKENLQATKGYIKCGPQTLKRDMLHVRNLDPVEFRILHLFVHAALLAGYSLDLSTDVLPDVMKDENPSETCHEIIQMDLEVLSSLLCCKKEKIMALLYHTIDEASVLLTDDAGLPLPLDEKGRSAWEAYFAKKVQPVIQQFRCDGFTSLLVDKDDDLPFKAVIEEHQLPQYADVSARYASIARLFRVTQPNTFQKLREVLLNSPKDFKDKHQLLGLFLDYHDSLHHIGNLAALIPWIRRVDSLLSRQLTRTDAQEKKILELVIKPNGDSAREEFEEFKKAWRNVVPLVNATIQNGDEKYISAADPVGYCLLENKDKGRFLCQCLIVLAEMQNEFLDKCLAIASSGKCPALHFLVKGGSSVPSFPVVHIQDAKRKEIIRYEWTNSFLDFSYCATEYGQGKNITYEMAKIEKEMAGCFLLGKSYLDTTSGIREFVFSKQLFHDCADILNKLCEAIPQEKLPGSVQAELNRSANRSMDKIQALLGYLELVLCYMKRMEVNPEESLVTCTEMWMPKPFPRDLLPTTLNIVQIKHVCALYEFVEDQLAIHSVDCIGQPYLEKILDKTKEMMKERSQSVDTIVLEAVVTAIKRFAFRYLHKKPDPGDCLLDFMRDPSLWPMALRAQRDDIPFKAAPEFFPAELTVDQTYEVHKFYKEELQKFTRKPLRSRFPPVKPKPPPRGPKKGRKLFS